MERDNSPCGQDEGYAPRLTSRPRATGPKACVNFFLNRISSSSGEDRSCWKGVKIGFGYRWLVEVDDCWGLANAIGRLGSGQWMGLEVAEECLGVCMWAGVPAVYWLTDDGIGRGYLEGFAGGGKRSRALLLVKGWVAKGSKEPRVG